jgi:hypothetical protein
MKTEKKQDRPTVGKIATDLMKKEPETRSVVELEREMHQDYERNVYETISTGKKMFDGDFFIVVLTKRERLLQNVIRHYFLPRESCPTPDYDQAVYRFHRFDDKIEFLWVIPAKEACLIYLRQRNEVDPTEFSLLSYVLQFADGTLGKLAKKLNGECPDTDLLAA